MKYGLEYEVEDDLGGFHGDGGWEKYKISDLKDRV